MSRYGELLPIGSVVLLKGGEKRVMICGRIQAKNGESEVFDYSGCMFPQGIISSDSMYFFNHEDIDTVYFIGCQDAEELAFKNDVLSQLGELEVRNGEIVSK